MQYNVETVKEYLNEIPEERKEAIAKLRAVIKENIPIGFQECINYGMIGYVVPHSLYPSGYHCNPKDPLPFIGFASQKNFISFYHMGIYADQNLLNWFTSEFPKHSKKKLDMGKNCIRFKKPDDIPFDLLAELVRKISPADWITLYEQNFKRK